MLRLLFTEQENSLVNCGLGMRLSEDERPCKEHCLKAVRHWTIGLGRGQYCLVSYHGIKLSVARIAHLLIDIDTTGELQTYLFRDSLWAGVPGCKLLSPELSLLVK